MENNNKKTLILTVIGVLTLILIVGGATYAYINMISDGGSGGDINTTTGTTDSLMFKVEKGMNITVTQDNFTEGKGNLTDSTLATATLVANNTTNQATATYNVYLEIIKNTFKYTTEDKKAEILLQITAPDGREVTSIEGLSYVTINGISGFDVTQAGQPEKSEHDPLGLIQTSNIKTIAKDYEIEATSSEAKIDEWELTIILVNLETSQNENIGKGFQAEIKLQKEEIEAPVQTLFYHDEALANGANDKSYRYSGASSIVKNYVCFGSNEATCPEDNLYRIIGYFNVAREGQPSEYQMKLIKATPYVGQDAITSSYTSSGKGYYWSGSSSNSSNVWANSTLNKTTLNGEAEGNYLHDLGEEWISKIANHTWKVGGYSSSNVTPKVMHTNEVANNKTTYDAKVGLMYVSDYGYGTSPGNWTRKLYDSSILDYRQEEIRNNNWLYLGSSDREWLLSRNSSDSYNAFFVYAAGDVNSYNVGYGQYAVRPSIYLRSDVTLRGGSGTETNPYRIEV